MKSKIKIKQLLNNMIKSLPKEVDINDFVFCCSNEFDYGETEYKGINLYYFNIIEEDTIYLMYKKNYEELHFEESYYEE